MRTSVLLFFIALAATAVAGEEDVIIKPLAEKSGQPSAYLVFALGAMIPAERYRELAVDLQKAAPFSLWVAVPAFPLDLDMTAALVEKAAKRVEAAMEKQGLDTSSALHFVGGHSMGAASVQDYTAELQTPPAAVALLGASLLRKYNLSFPSPVVSVVGELDGLQRMARVAEAYWTHVQSKPDYEAACASAAVVVLEGSSHMQPATGDATATVKRLDLAPEISGEEARLRIAEIVADFFTVAAHPDKTARAAALKRTVARVRSTGELVAPLIQAMEMEGSYHLRAPCNSDTPSPHCPFYPVWPPQAKDRTPSDNTKCQCGCPWVMQVAQAHVSGIEGDASLPIVVADAFHDVRDTKPYHHSHLWSDCYGKPRPCTMNYTTVSQAIYDIGDSADTGFTYASAHEIRCKMKSRQATIVNSTDRSALVNVTDKGHQNDFCREINERSYKWALERAGKAAKSRFERFGQQMVMGEDITSAITVGPMWIYNPLHYNTVTLADNSTVVEVRSPAMITDIAGSPYYPDANGYHYCKLLSPARVMEWIYTDGLRLHMGL